MSGIKHIALLLIFSVANLAYTESVSDQLKVADCNFTILNEGKPVQVLKQMITLRAVSDIGAIKTAQNQADAYGTGYRAYYIEFLYAGDHLDYARIKRIEFYIDKKRIHVIDMQNTSRRISESERRTKQASRYFAINLENIPLLMLDDVTTINFID